MPLTERDPNVGGRPASRASVGSKASINTGPDALSNPGVLSMLRTSTEMVAPRQTRHRSTSRQSGSLGYGQFSPDTMSPTLVNIPGHSRDVQSFSHGSKLSYSLSNQPSQSSLRSNRSAPRSSSPFRYPTRLKRPGMRPVSPALSDITSMHPAKLPGAIHVQHVPRSRTPHPTKAHQLPTGEEAQTVYPEIRPQLSRDTLNPLDFSGPGPMIYASQMYRPVYELTQYVELPAGDVKIEPIELPAEPVGKRITRALIMEALQMNDPDEDEGAESYGADSPMSSREFKRDSSLSETPSTSNTVCSLSNESRSTLTTTVTKPSLHEADSNSTLARTLKGEGNDNDTPTPRPSCGTRKNSEDAPELKSEACLQDVESPKPQPTNPTETVNFVQDVITDTHRNARTYDEVSAGPLHVSEGLYAETTTRSSDSTTHLVWNNYNRSFATSTYSINEIVADQSAMPEPLLIRHQMMSGLSDVREESFEDESRPVSMARPSESEHEPEPEVEPEPEPGRDPLIPSLDFSHTNLVAKLQEALDDPGVTEILNAYDERTSQLPLSDRPSSSLRDRYKSFFANLEVLDRPVTKFTTMSDIDPHNVLNELAKLSIPSVGALTQRLSELLPSFSQYAEVLQPEPEEEEPYLQHARSSSRLRPLPGLPELIVMDDNLFDLIRKPPADSREYGRVSRFEDGNWPSPAFRRRSTPSTTFADDTDLGTQLRRLMKRASPESSPGDGRPWNHDRYYPWAMSAPDIELHIPESTHSRATSGADTARSPPLDDRDSIRPASQAGSGMTKPTLEGSKREMGDRVPSRRSVIGTLKDLLPGDRYPTTSLAPPAGLILDEVRSYFSDDSDHFGEKGMLRRRLTSLRVRIPGSRTQSMDKRLHERTLSTRSKSAISSPGCARNLTDGLPVAGGMGPVEFRARKVAQKLKVWWFRSGQYLRYIGRRKQVQYPHREETPQEVVGGATSQV